MFIFMILRYYKTMNTITLIGMMGSGKTTLGKLLGKKLNLPSVDIDLIIEKENSQNISEIFSKYGEDFFRKLEKSTIEKVLCPDGQIISTGGGAFEDSETRELLLNNSTVIYLKTTPESILKRIKNNKQRPLLKDNMNIENISKIINKRRKNYEMAHYTIVTDEKTPNDIAEEILGVL